MVEHCHVTDYKGYLRDFHSRRLVSREVAFEHVYRRNRRRYPLPFRCYLVHHKDGNKRNNNPDNLELFTRKEHDKLHSSFNISQLRGIELRRRRNKFLFRVSALAFASVLSFSLSYLLSSRVLALLGVVFGFSAVYVFLARIFFKAPCT